MKVCRFLIMLLVLFCIYLPSSAAEKRSQSWDNLIEISYKFTWYPRKDIQELLKSKSNEYQQSLEEYQNILIAELTDGAATQKSIDPELFVRPKPWKLYYRLAIAEFCSFLARDDTLYLENAISILSVISARKEMTYVSFWHSLFQSYYHLKKKERDAFVKSVFQLWNDAVLQAEINQTVVKSEAYEPELSDLTYFYENTAHLIVTKAILEEQLSDLHPLAAIVISLAEKLKPEIGYKRFLEAIVERLKGLKSDNSNLNFAVAFVEATAKQYEFEDELSKEAVAGKYNAARLTYELALSWANTRKGKTALLTQYMGFNNYIVRRLVEKDTLLTSNAIFLEVPNQAVQLADTSIALYHELAESSDGQNKFVHEGFNKRSNYIEAMHQLWDSIAKLLMTLASYHQVNHQTEKMGEAGISEVFALKYLTLFNHYSQTDSEIVPNNAFYLAAYAASHLSALYSEAKQYSTSMHYNNLAFAYQLQAVELFPLDIVGILKLAHQTDQENRQRIYFQYVVPLARRLRNSTVAWTWMDKNLGAPKNAVQITSNVVPDIVENAFVYLNALQQTPGPLTEEVIYNKLLVTNGLYLALKKQNLDDQIPDAMSSVARRDFSGADVSLKKVFKAALPPDIRETVSPPAELETKFSINRLKNELYAAPKNQIHSLLRDLYFEDTVKSYRQLLKLKK